MICCFCAGEDGVAHGICQTDASVTLPTMIRCICAGEDEVAHGICQTNAVIMPTMICSICIGEDGMATASVRQMRLSHCLP
jgi:hypothetical protein